MIRQPFSPPARPGFAGRPVRAGLRRGGRRGGAVVLGLALLFAANGLPASNRSRVRTVEQLRAAFDQRTLIPRVFTKGDRVHLYFADAEQQVLFKADWDRTRLRTAGFSSHVATLKFDPSPAPLPRPQDKWREVKVLAFEEWTRLAHQAVERLMPSEAGSGLYLQFALGDAVLFRDAGGEIRAVPFADRPPGINLDRRYNRIEAANLLAGSVQANLQAAYPQVDAFALVPPPDGQRLRLVLLDLAERRVVELFAPRTGESPRGSTDVVTDASGLASFFVLDHGWAILKNPVTTAGRLVNQLVQWPLSLLGPRLRNRGSVIPPLTNAPAMDLAAWEHWLDRHTPNPRERGAVRLLINGENFFPVFEDRLAAATRAIDIQVFIFDRDDVAVEVADRLKERSTNVAVRVMYDHNSTRAAGKTPPCTPMAPGFVPPKSISNYLEADSQVRARPLLNPFLKFDHTKVFLIDGQCAFLGGMNLGREYRYEWHDLMVEVEGPVVASLQWEFDSSWAYAGPLGDFACASHSLFGKRPAAAPARREDFIDVRRLYTKTGRRQIREAVLAVIRRAQNHVFLENPYLYDNSVIVALVKARLRGVDVRVILPSMNDYIGGESSNLVTANYLLKHGVRVYFYPGMTHVKAVLADGWACFGSANFNTLSLRLNQEVNLATSEAGFVAGFRRDLFETDFEKSYELKEPVSVNWTDHLADSLLNQF